MSGEEKKNKQIISKENILNAIRDTFAGLVIGLLIMLSGLIFGNWAELIDVRIRYSDPNIAIAFIQQYSNFCLTLFGFSLIGGIFAGKKNNENKKIDKKKDTLEITKRTLMLSSLLFLFGFIMFNLLYLIVYPALNEKYVDAVPWIFNFGIGSFGLGIAFLFFTLIFFFVRRYTGLTDRWHNFWNWAKINISKDKKNKK